MEPDHRARRTLGGRTGRRALGGLAVLIGLVGLVAVGCSSAPTEARPALTVAGAWARPAAAGGDSAAYLTIINQGADDRLLSVRCTIAASTMLHRTATDVSGMTGMSMLEDLAVPAGATVRLEPGGAHVMIGGLARALAVGESLELRLVFDHAGEIVVPVTIQPG